MFYFESIKINSNNLNPFYKLTLKLESNKEHYVTSDNQEWINDLYYFMKNRSKFILGKWFIDDYELTSMNNKDYVNFILNNISFGDEDLILDKNWKLKKIILFQNYLLKVKKNFANNVLKNIDITEEELNTKFSDLDTITKIKLMFYLTLIKNTKFIICNFTKYNINTFDSLVINQLVKKLINNFNITIICLVQNDKNDLSKINIDSNEYLFFNKIFTIGDTNYKTKKYKFQKYNIFNSTFRYIKYEFLILFSITLILNFLTIFILSVPNITFIDANLQNLNIFATNNKILWNIFGYSCYLLVYVVFITWMALCNKKILKYTNLLDTIGIRHLYKFLTWGLIIFFINVISILISFFLNFILFITTKSGMQNLWYVLCLFLYMIYLIIMSLVLIIKSNQIFNKLTYKEMLIKLLID